MAAEVSMTGLDLPRSLLREDATITEWHEKETSLSQRDEIVARPRISRRLGNFTQQPGCGYFLLESWNKDDGRVSLGFLLGLLGLPAKEIDTDEV